MKYMTKSLGKNFIFSGAFIVLILPALVFSAETPAPVPVAPRPDESVTTSQAAPFARIQTELSPHEHWLGSEGPQFRPYVGIEWFNVEGAKTGGTRVNASWAGPKVQGEVALMRWPVGEFGLGGSVYKSAIGMSPDGKQSSLLESRANAHLLLKANTTAMGVPMLRLTAGYLGNWRTIDPSSPPSGPFLSSFSGPRAGGEISTYVDGIFTVGMNGGYTFARDGLIEAGGFVSHRFLKTGDDRSWDARFGLSVANAMQRSGVDLLEESWSTFQFGLIGSL